MAEKAEEFILHYSSILFHQYLFNFQFFNLFKQINYNIMKIRHNISLDFDNKILITKCGMYCVEKVHAPIVAKLIDKVKKSKNSCLYLSKASHLNAPDRSLSVLKIKNYNFLKASLKISTGVV